MCGFLDDEGSLATSGLLVTDNKDIAVLRIGSCPNLLLVAVGGGGSGRGGYGAGSGSGYIEYLELVAYQSAYTLYEARPGGSGSPSTVRSSDGTTVILALKGMTPDGNDDGAPGYSGGGAFNAGAGGCDGGDGEDSTSGQSAGGKGSNFNVTTIPLKNFSMRYELQMSGRGRGR